MDHSLKKKNFGQIVAGSVRQLFKSTAGMVFVVTILLTLVVNFATGGNFYTAYNISTFTRAASFTIIVGFAQTFVLLLGGIDLSVASIAGLCSMIFAMLILVLGVDPYVAIAIALLAGIGMGAINGFFICKLSLTPFIVTLATSALFRGIVYVATKGVPLTGIPESVTVIGQGSLGFLPYPTLIMIGLAVVLILTLKYTSFGRHVYAVGGNEEASKIVGIRVNKTKMGVYSLAGLLCAAAGVLMVLRMGSSQVNIGENWVMPSITAAVLGGTSMNGGSGGIGGTIVGGFLMSTIAFSISLLGISSYWDQVVTGLVVLVAISIDAIRRSKQASL
jgi:ribose transport system permease protein